MYCPNANTQAVEASGGNHETDAVEHGILIRRQFGSVSMPVKNSEEAHEKSSEDEWWAHFEQYCCTEKNGRCCDAVFDTWDRYAHQSKHSSEGHHQWKRD